MKKTIIIISLSISILLLLIVMYFNLGIQIKDNIINYGMDDKLYYYPTLFHQKLKLNVKTNKYDLKKVGSQNIKFNIYLGKLKLKSIEKEITINDNDYPIITLTGEKEIKLYVNEEYKELGFIASDIIDGDLTDEVIIENNIDNTKAGEYSILYSVKDINDNETKIIRKIKVIEKNKPINFSSNDVEEPTYIDGILIVNKTYALPSSYAPLTNKEASNALSILRHDAAKEGFTYKYNCGYRSYNDQKIIYNGYLKDYSQEEVDSFSARPGHSEHQTGLAFDIGVFSEAFGSTPEGLWLANNAYKYGFIIRYPKGKEDITGYSYEPWHVRYLGKDIAKKVYDSGLCLEEYLHITSSYE